MSNFTNYNTQKDTGVHCCALLATFETVTHFKFWLNITHIYSKGLRDRQTDRQFDLIETSFGF